MTYALRGLRRTPGVTAGCVLTLSLGIGAAAAVFGVVYGVLLRPLPVTDPATLIQLNGVTTGGTQNFSLAELDDWKARTRTLSHVAGFSSSQVAVSDGAETTPVPGAVVSADFFATLDAPLLLGRGLGPGDDLSPSIVISERFWRQRLGGDPAAIGRAIRLNDQARTIIGVGRASFRFPAGDTDVWVPMGYARQTAPPQWNMRGFRGFSMIARLSPGTRIAEARADADRVARELGREFPRFNRDTEVVLTPLLAHLTAPARPALLLLLAAAALVVAATGANVTNLLLARGLTLRRDVSVRLAIGAGRLDIARQVLAETGLMVLGGSIGGLGVAAGALFELRRLNPAILPRLEDVRLDAPVLLFTAGVACLLATAIGGASALQTWTMEPGDGLREARGTGTPRSRRLHTALVLLQITASVLLLIGGTVLVRSVSALLRVPLGVRTEGVYAARVDLAGVSFAAPAQQTAFLGRLLDAIAALPDVAGAAVVSSLPPGGSQMRTSVAPAGAASGANADVVTEIVAISPDAFSVLGVRLIAGRAFAPSDSADAPRVLILSQLAAKQLFPGRDPIGQTIPIGASSGGTGPPTVVGIAGDVRYAGLDVASMGAVYLPFTQRPFRSTYLIVRAASPGAPVASAVRQVVSSLDPGVAVGHADALDSVVSDAVAQPRFRATLLTLLSALVLSVAAVGLYGVMAHAVSARRAELAVRLALGAAPRRLLAMVMWRGLRLTASGVALGVLAGLALVRLMSTLVFGVSTMDAVSFGVAASVMLIVGLMATAVPAWRASRVDPIATLKG